MKRSPPAAGTRKPYGVRGSNRIDFRLPRRPVAPYNVPLIIGLPSRLTEVSAVSTDRYLFTSESVSMGHPDKVADQISDAVLDHCLSADPTSRVACETLVTTDLVVIAGEITTNADMSKEAIDWLVRKTIREIGYTDARIGFSAETCK